MYNAGMSKIKKILAMIVLIVFISVSIFIISNNSKNIIIPSNQVASSGKTSFTISDVAKHATAESCWSIVNNEVYDLTTWISKHPGGSEAILSICGKDASSAFNDQHGGQKRPANELAGFIIGDLKK